MQTDKFGNKIDTSVSYARGQILGDFTDESLRLMNGRRLVREWILKHGEDSVYNLTALSRAFPIDLDDVALLKNQFTYFANFDGAVEEQIVRFLDGDPKKHFGFVMNRISSAMIAIMCSLLEPGDILASIVPKGRSHPSVERGVKLAQGVLKEFKGVDGAHQAAALSPKPKLAMVTPLTHAKHHMDHADLIKIIAILEAEGISVFVDDAHVAARKGIYNEPGGLAHKGVDLAIFSPDKHMIGPRAGALAGRKDLVRKIQGFSFAHGIDAQSSQAAATYRSILKYDPKPLADAGEAAKVLLARLQERYGKDKAYSAGPGVGMSEDHVMELAMERVPGCNVSIMPLEGSSVVCMWLLEKFGIVTIPCIGMPGCSPALRFMLYPDGPRYTVDRIMEVFDQAIDALAGVLDKPHDAARIILGPYAETQVRVA